MERWDAIVVGAGHNGLVLAFYLARAGLRVKMLERRHIVGGAAVTEEFAPGFRNSVASYTVSLLDPRIIRDMRLHDHGYRAIERPLSNFLPLPDGRHLTLGGGLEATQARFRAFSPADADALPAYYRHLDSVAGHLRRLSAMTPPNAGGGLPALLALARQGGPMLRLPLDAQRDLVDLFAKPASSFLERWFESDPVKAIFGFDSVVGNYASPETPGSAYVLLHHVFGEVNGRKGAWGHSIGGMGAITQAMAAACRALGVDIETEAPVERVLVDGARVVGVEIAGGRRLHARRIVANVGPKLLYERLIDPADLPPGFLARIRAFRAGSGSFRMNVALDRLPRFACLPERGDHLAAGIIIAPSLAYMDRAFIDAKRNGIPDAPIVEMLIPSLVDDSLAPPGMHVASLFCQQFAPILPDGRSWDTARDEAADRIVATVDAYAPGFAASIVARQALSPLDLERTFGLVGGDIFHGAMTPDQLWSFRPLLGNAAYRGPLAGLYMCGAGAHPGGGVSGMPGRNAARAVLADRFSRR